MASSSFQNKRKVKGIDIKGTKTVLANKLLLVSTGISYLDALLGGGIAVGSIVLIEEDLGRVYSDFLLKCFLAEGALSEHELFISSLDSPGSEIIKDLPGLSSIGKTQNNVINSNTDLKIAWRYKDMECQAENDSSFGHTFDMSKKLNEEIIQKTKTTVFDKETLFDVCLGSEIRATEPFKELLMRVSSNISEGGFSTGSGEKHTRIIRLGIHSFGSPQWNFASDDSEFSFLMCRLLTSLKHLTRTSFSVAFLTMPTHLFQDSSIINRIEHLCDAVFRLESFAATPLEQKEVWKDYNGLFHVVKLPRLNSVAANSEGDNSDLVFKVKRRQFIIEKMHLPPLFTTDDVKSSCAENGKKTAKNSPCSQLSVDF